MDEPAKPADAKKFRVTRESVASHTAAWQASTMKKYGRIGRDPDRIKPFLMQFTDAWGKHASYRFGQLVGDACGDIDPAFPEEGRFLELLAEWTAAHPATGGDTARIGLFMNQIESYWLAQPDLRFGQLVSNFARKDPSLPMRTETLTDF